MTFPTTWIVWVTPVLIIWLVLSLWIGYKRGFLLQLYNLLALFAAVLFSWILSEPFAKVFTIFKPDVGAFNQTAIEEIIQIRINSALWFVILFIAISLLIMLGRPLIKAIGKIPGLKTINSFFGAVFALLGCYITVLILILLLSTPLITNGQTVVEESGLSVVKQYSSVFFDYASDRFEENAAIQKMISGETLTGADSASIRDWLLSQGISETDIIQFLEGLN
ncbi:MAG: CvpA family protein [Erysipelotrichaceae bacterium]|nr:CvpA family protein [Erysipelotrichaceae bacterium]